MFPNDSLPTNTVKPSKDDQETTVGISAIMDNVSIILYALTVLLCITGNSVVIWVAGFKFKVNTSVDNTFQIPSELVSNLFSEVCGVIFIFYCKDSKYTWG